MASRAGGRHERDWRDITRGARINLLGILTRSLRATYLVFAARIFGSELLGLFLLGWAAVDVISKFGIFGLDRGLLRFLPEQQGPANRVRLIGTALIIACATGFLTSWTLASASPWIASSVLQKEALSPGLRILAWAILPLAVSTLLLALTRSQRLMQYEVLVRSLIEPGLLLSTAVVLSVVGSTALGLFQAQFLASLGGGLVAVWFAWRLGLVAPVRWLRENRGWPGPKTWSCARQLIFFTLPIALYDFLAIGVMSLDMFMLARYITPREIGIYGAAIQVAILVKKARQSYEPILLPVLSERLAQGDHDAAHRSLDAVTSRIAAIDFGFLLAVALFGREILWLFGPEFVEGAGVLVLLAFAYSLNGFWGICENIVLLKKPYWNLLNWAGCATLALLSNLLLIPRYGTLGAAGSMVLVFLVLALLRAGQTYRLIGWNPFNKGIVRPALVSFSLGLAVLQALSARPDPVILKPLLGVAAVALYVTVLVKWSQPALPDAATGVAQESKKDLAWPRVN